MFLPLHQRRFLRATLLLVLCMLGTGLEPSAVAGPQKPHGSKRDEKRQIEELEEQWRRAMVADDAAIIDALLADDYVGISVNGQANTKAQQLDRIRSRRLVITKMDLSDSKVKLVGTIAIVTSLAQIEGTNEGAPMKGTYRYTRIYERLPSGFWKTTNFEATRVPNRLSD